MDRIRPTDTTEEITENLTDPEASATFKEVFYAEAKALEKEALEHSVEVDEERKEALRRRILQSVGAEVEGTEALEKRSEGVAEKVETAEDPMFEAASPAGMPERKHSMEASEEIAPEGMSEKKSAAGTSKSVYSMGSSEAADSEEASAKAYTADTKRKKRRFSPFVRWAAVLALACVGVLGVSMTSQAKGSGLWSSIQRLIGVETRWEQENNGEDRTYTSPEEYKAIGEIEEKLGIEVPEFFYWPEGIHFLSTEIFEDSGNFVMIYEFGDKVIYFEGCSDVGNASVNKEWEGKGKTNYIEYGNVSYKVTEVYSENNNATYYYVTWKVNSVEYVLSGTLDKKELENILKNIKN